MIDKRLINNIFQYLKKGYTKEAIYNVYVRSGYNQKNVTDTINYVESIHNKFPKPTAKPYQAPSVKQEKKFNINRIIIIFLSVLAVIGLVSASVIFITRPVCGDGKVEGRESTETCCQDAGCVGQQSCVENTCVGDACGECQYLSGYECMDYECCLDTDCDGDSSCQNNFCKKLTCDSCQYIADNSCVSYECCSDEQCNDFDSLTVDKCMSGSTINSYCSHQPLGDCSTNEDCDDDDVSTQDVCTGIPKQCSNIQIIQCVNHDDYCPPGCTYALDLDCTAPQCSTVADCDDGNASTKDICGGAPRRCLYAPIKECETGDGYCPAGCFYQDDQDCANVSQVNLAIFFFKNIETCFVGDVCTSNCFELTKTGGEIIKNFTFNGNLKSINPSNPSLSDYGEDEKQCLNLTLSSGKITNAKNLLQQFEADVFSISDEKIEINFDYNRIDAIEVNLTKFDDNFWLAVEDVEEIVSAGIDEGIDGIIAISEVYDSNLDIYFPIKHCNKTITNAIKGTSYSWIPKTTGYSSECLTKDNIFHSWLYQVDFALSEIMDIDEEYDDSGDYPSCGQGVGADQYFPSPADCLNDPDSSFCGQSTCNPDGWHTHLLSDHYNFGGYIGNHCRNSREDFDETGVDSGGSCS